MLSRSVGMQRKTAPLARKQPAARPQQREEGYDAALTYHVMCRGRGNKRGR